MAAAAVVIAASVLMGCINMGEAWNAGGDEGVIHVGGRVLCQDCTKSWNHWLHPSNPIQGSKVSITCMDERRRVTYYGSDETDKEGEFNMVIPKYVKGKEVKERGCKVRVVSSPDPACNIPTDFAGGRSGVNLGTPSIVYRHKIKHTMGPFYYTTPMCEEPETGESN
ncbi:pistil-specific extensin-like protein [Malania oleifera]|uniref:pistil-specific extensin-like protein n=1 Tax=Malania oleifera TaxID=397392 RepID=UPI0025AE2739|nr:pistil-specific extensin-like protein [Malania oleifera]